MRYLTGRDVLQAIPLSKFKHWDKTIPLFTKGEYPDGRKASRQGTMPLNILYATSPTGQKVTDGTPTEWVTGIPTVTNAPLMDGPVRTLTSSISPQTFEALATIAGGEAVGTDW